LPFHFSVMKDDPCPATHEPVALPGGYIFLPAALFLEAHDEAEFAGMLAHSMEHIARRHVTRLASVSGNMPLLFVGGWNGGCGDTPLGFVATQRRNELDADAAAIETLARADFDARAFVRYIERVETDDIGRVAAMQPLIQKLYVSGYEVPSGDFVAIHREVLRLILE